MSTVSVSRKKIEDLKHRPSGALEQLALLAKSEAGLPNEDNSKPIGKDSLRDLAEAAQRGDSFSMQSTLPNYDALQALSDAAQRGDRVSI